jgi:hypothetical protein
MKRGLGQVLGGALALAIALASPRAAAGVADTVGLDPRETALAGSTVARPGGFYALWSNPAGLARTGAELDRPGFAELSVGAVSARPRLSIEAADGRRLEPDAAVGDVFALILGSRFDLGRLLHLPGLTAGFALSMPTRVFRWAIRPDDRFAWHSWSDRTEQIGIRGGLAYRATPWLSLGAGLRVLFDTETNTTGRVTRVERTVNPETGESGFDVGTQLGGEVTVYGRAAPAFGAQITPTSAVTIGIVYRHRIFVDDWGWTRIQGAPGTGDLGYVHRFAHFYHPTQLALAASTRLGAGLEASFDLTYSRWSDALTKNHQALGPGRFGDTLTPAIGISLRAHERLVVMGGYRFAPTPFDNLGGPTNLLENDRHVTSTGVDLALGAIDGVDLRLRASAQVTWLVTREETKDPRRFPDGRAVLTNPGYPGYRYGGRVPAASLALEAGW